MSKKEIKITRMECPTADWKRVLNAARRTVGKKPIDKEPSDSFKKEILLAEHSPIRLLEYDFTIENIRQWVTTHVVRHHMGCEKFVNTQRQDINDEIEGITKKIIDVLSREGLLHDGWRERDYLFQGQENTMDMSCNAQSFINISRKRLCRCASPETREAWELVIEYLKEVDPVLASKCVPECIYRSFCPEKRRCCGYINSDKCKREIVYYQSFEEEVWKEVDGHEGFFVSTLGRVKRKEFFDTEGRYHAEHFVSIINNKKRNGYDYVHLADKYKSLSRLVAETFIPNPLNKPEVNHINGNKYDNTINNLEWVTSLENKQRAWDNGLCDAKHKMQKIKCIETGEIFASYSKAVKWLGKSYTSVSTLVRGTRNYGKAFGYHWEFID